VGLSVDFVFFRGFVKTSTTYLPAGSIFFSLTGSILVYSIDDADWNPFLTLFSQSISLIPSLASALPFEMDLFCLEGATKKMQQCGIVCSVFCYLKLMSCTGSILVNSVDDAAWNILFYPFIF
jgi:hypothetical protein